jgi:hypothetical protein
VEYSRSGIIGTIIHPVKLNIPVREYLRTKAAAAAAIFPVGHILATISE